MRPEGAYLPSDFSFGERFSAQGNQLPSGQGSWSAEEDLRFFASQANTFLHCGRFSFTVENLSEDALDLL